MRNEAPALLPVFRSQVQAEILTELLLHPGDEYTLTELADQTGASVPSIHREVSRLVESGLLSNRTQGRNRLVTANPHHPATEPLTRLVEVSFGPKPLVADIFSELGADKVIIFGSWAARYSGQVGNTPHDIDVLVVGDVPRTEMYAAADEVQARLKFPVNPVLRTVQQWESGEDKLVAQIKESPYAIVIERN